MTRRRTVLSTVATLYLGAGWGLSAAGLLVAASPILGPYAPVQLPGDLAFGFPFVATLFLGATATGWQKALGGLLVMTLSAGTGIAAVFLAPVFLGYTPERGAALNLATQQAFGSAFVILLTAVPGLVVGLGICHLSRRQD